MPAMATLQRAPWVIISIVEGSGTCTNCDSSLTIPASPVPDRCSRHKDTIWSWLVVTISEAFIMVTANEREGDLVSHRPRMRHHHINVYNVLPWIAELCASLSLAIMLADFNRMTRCSESQSALTKATASALSSPPETTRMPSSPRF